MNAHRLLLLGGMLALACTPRPSLSLHYGEPAAFFEESLLLGNGQLGAIVYGGTEKDRISLNDITLWTGEPFRDTAAPAAWLPVVREALEQEDYQRADQLQRNLQSKNSNSYQPLGSLEIAYPDDAQITDYQRVLDISQAQALVSYRRNGKAFSCQYLVSAPDSVIVLRLRSEAPIRATLRMHSQQPHTLLAEGHSLLVDGYTYSDAHGIHFRTTLLCEQAQAKDDALVIDGPREALIVVANRTSFNGSDKDPVLEGREYKQASLTLAQKAAAKGWNKLEKAHTKDYKALFDRVQLNLGATPDSIRVLPTDRQLLRYAEGEANPELEALYFQYGRYLLIASSRTEGVPANLQGLWNESLTPPWSSNYTTNINLEENYWMAESAALPQMHASLLGFLHSLSKNGEQTARNYYGVQEGWCEAHNSDIWAMTCPVGEGSGDPFWANWNMGGAWLSTHIWEHWLFTRDRAALERDYPVLKGAAQFCLGVLIEKNGELITSPGTSPENIYRTPDGYTGASAYGVTADLAIIRECLTDAAAAARELGDTVFVKRVDATLPRLRGYHVGKNGALQEWYHDWEEPAPWHRHQSHLIGVYPGHQIEAGTPLADAALKTLEIKGFETTGWSCGWRVNLYARLHQAEKAYQMYRRLLRYVSPDKYTGADARRGGGTYPNLLDAHPPFQIDGNFGGSAGVVEMLLQSTPDRVIPLPALPKAWPNGWVKGLRTRTGQTVDMRWENGQLTEYKLR